MAREEPDRTKRAKLDALQLSKDEWDRVALFLDLLVVMVFSRPTYQFTYTHFSMPNEHNKPSPQMKAHHFTQAFRRLKPFTRPGLHEQRKESIPTFGML